MKSRTTAIWFMLALALVAAIWVLNTYFQPAATGERPLFPGLHANRVTSIQIIPGGEREIDAIYTNKTWQLQRPFVYPAQQTAIEGLLGTLEKLTPVLSFSPSEMSGKKNADAELGFDSPQFSLDLTAGEQTWHVRVGRKTAPGDGVYVQVVGAPGAYVTDVNWLQFLPHDANVWRDTTLVDMPDVVDWLVITNGSQAIELRRDITNRLWRMVRPLQARANDLLILTALQQLHTAKVSHFVTDDPKADPTTYGLVPAALDVWLGTGTNLITGIHAGKEITGLTGEVYARREGWNSVVATAKEPLAPWRGKVNDFRDPNLLKLTAPVAEIEVQGQTKETSFTLQKQGSNSWTIVGQKFPTDAERVDSFVRTLASLRIADFAQDVVTGPGLQSFGLASPSRQITLRSIAGNTNSVIAQLLFGTSTTNQIYVKRADEVFVYAITLDDLNRLPQGGDFFRDPQIWNFSETNVAQVTMQQNGKTRQFLRTGNKQWSLGANSQGIIDPRAIEDSVHRLGQLAAYAWIGRDFNDANLGLSTNSLSVTMEMKSGEKYSVNFGGVLPLPSLNTRTPLAVVTLDGERWAFVFPPVLFPLIQEYFTIPSDTP